MWHAILKNLLALAKVGTFESRIRGCGWHGSRLTMEFVNVRRFHPQHLYPGRLVGQMVFKQMLGAPLKDYKETGRYNGDLKVTASKG